MSGPAHRNRLAREASAYLLQHAGNPVDWYPWSEEALSRARELDRPILLSIGYSACHWCHVMERESFEDDAIAALMNEHFVCIKVDREERPDLDHLYMKALQGMTGRGGWPMTVFLTPDARPFYAGTYFPPEDRSGMPGFPRVLLGVAKTWSEQRGDVDASASRMVEYLATTRSRAAEVPLDEDAIAQAAATLEGMIDDEHGGFGRAPKFPGTMALSLLMQVDSRQPDPRRRELVRLSLDRMAAGGIRDHLGGGFHRYSVDRVWLVPHFEKMLYDQALLACVNTEASKFFANPAYLRIAVETADYVVREMTADSGGFFSAQDADSEGEEGRFFVWSRAEVLEVLGAEAGEKFCQAYGISEEGNFEGASILHRSPDAPAEPALEVELADSRRRLHDRRATRVAPETDRKIVADWNGLMIGAMAGAGRLAGRPDLVEVAERAAAFVRSSMIDSTGLHHVHAAGAARVPAFLDDYAFFGRACLDLFAASPREEHLACAAFCADRILADFADGERGGFYFAAASGESLVARTADLNDGAVPAGNSVAAELLLRLWSLTGEDRYRSAGEAVLDRFGGEALHYPYGAPQLLSVALRMRRGMRTAVAVGRTNLRERLSQTALEVYDPGCTVIELKDSEQPWWPSALRAKSAPGQGAAIFLCEGTSCSLPITDEASLVAALGGSPPATEVTT